MAARNGVQSYKSYSTGLAGSLQVPAVPDTQTFQQELFQTFLLYAYFWFLEIAVCEGRGGQKSYTLVQTLWWIVNEHSIAVASASGKPHMAHNKMAKLDRCISVLALCLFGEITRE